MINKIKEKYLVDYFIIIKKNYWFLLPTPIFYYDKNSFFESGKTSPSFGFTIRFLNLMVGVQIQKNLL